MSGDFPVIDIAAVRSAQASAAARFETGGHEMTQTIQFGGTSLELIERVGRCCFSTPGRDWHPGGHGSICCRGNIAWSRRRIPVMTRRH
jgi:hypothetical protein